MILVKLAYLLLLAGLVLFFMLFKDPLSLILLLSILLLPACSWLWLRIAGRRVQVRMLCPSGTLTAGEQAELQLSLQNPGILPIPHAVFRIRYGNTLAQQSETIVVSSGLPSGSSQIIGLQLLPEYCGFLRIEIVRIQLYDMLRMFRMNKRPPQAKELFIAPHIWPMQAACGQVLSRDSEQEVFSRYRPGDDPSEVFALREYQPGDRLNRIHWKLSEKNSGLIVKEFSLPLGQAAVLFVEWKQASLPEQHALLETLISASTAFSAADIPHNLCWFDPRNEQLTTVSVNDDSVYEGLRRLMSTPVHNLSSSLHCIEPDRSISHLVYLTGAVQPEQLARLEQLHADRITVFSIDADDAHTACTERESAAFSQIELCSVAPHRIEAALQGVVL